MMLRSAIVTAGLAFGLMSGAAQASYVVTFSQGVGGVTATGKGEFNLDLLNGGDSTPSLVGVIPSQGAVGFGPLPEESAQGALYNGFFIGPEFPFGDGSFGPGGAAAPTTSSGDVAAFDYGSDSVLVPTNYTSGTSLSSTMFFSGATFASLGLTTGSYTYSYGNLDLELAFRKDVSSEFGPAFSTDFIQVNVGTVPLPASAPLFGAALVALGMVGYGFKRAGKASA